jgi:hypothetical protein
MKLSSTSGHEYVPCFAGRPAPCSVSRDQLEKMALVCFMPRVCAIRTNAFTTPTQRSFVRRFLTRATVRTFAAIAPLDNPDWSGPHDRAWLHQIGVLQPALRRRPKLTSRDRLSGFLYPASAALGARRWSSFSGKRLWPAILVSSEHLHPAIS